MSDAAAPSRLARPGTPPRRAIWRPIGLLALIAALAVLAWPRVERHYLVRAGAAGKDALQLSVAGLRGALDRYEPLPALIAERPVLALLIDDPDDPALRAAVNALLLATADTLRLSDVYLMDMTGLTLAASSYRKPLSFVGQSFAYRPYFVAAVAGRVGRYFALGTTSGERGYFYAAPVWRDGAVIGVVAVKFTVDAFEETWRSGPSELMVTDGNGVVFMASRPEWHFRTLAPLSPAARADIHATRQYPSDRLSPLAVATTPFRDGLRLTRIGTGAGAETFVESDRLMADAGWRVHILTPAGPARAQAAGALGIGGMGLLLAGLAGALALSHRARILDRLAAQRETQGMLEARVRARTRDLDAANASLTGEVEERRNAENRLRIMQKELVQAGKLAALGQMSAAISHEINQPLAAVKTYAENAAQLIDRDRVPEARDNMLRISKMADRIAAIAGHLRNFARRPQEGIGPVDVCAVVDDARDLMSVRLRALGAELDVVRPEGPVMAMGGAVRLQQVIVNLLNNSLDAMQDDPAPRVSLTIGRPRDGTVRIAVRDHGPGLRDDDLAQVFDPFFTTKPPGKGLGLGLSISFNIVEDFGGHLRACNHEGGGAEFRVDLSAAPGTAVAP